LLIVCDVDLINREKISIKHSVVSGLSVNHSCHGSHGGRGFATVCLSVFFLHDISQTDAARITKPDIEMFHDEF